jgi:hypothetical protein
VKVEGLLFACGFVFFTVAGVVYWMTSQETAGTAALAFTAALAALVGYYLLFTGRRIDPRSEDRLDAEIAEGAGELGFFSPHSWWPLAMAGSAALAFLGIVFGWWLFIIGAVAGGLSVVGLVLEYHRGDPAH